MKTPTVDDAKPKRDNLGPTGPAKVSSEDDGDGSTASDGSAPPADASYENELENILDRKRAQTPPG